MIAQWDVRNLPLADESVDMIFTDPPYIKSQLEMYSAVAQEAMRVLKPGSFVAAMCGGNGLNRIMRWFDDAGLEFYWLYQLGMTGYQTGVVWKNGNNNVPISTRTKHVLVYSKGKALARVATVGLYWAGGADKRWHYWGQDIDSHRYYIDCFSAKGDAVLDPMCGGGTTGVACALLGRQVWLGDRDWSALEQTVRRMAGERESLDPLPIFAQHA